MVWKNRDRDMAIARGMDPREAETRYGKAARQRAQRMQMQRRQNQNMNRQPVKRSRAYNPSNNRANNYPNQRQQPQNVTIINNYSGYNGPSVSIYGIWVSKKGDRFTITPHDIIGMSGLELMKVDNDKIVIQQKGDQYIGNLMGEKILWTDGDVWTRGSGSIQQSRKRQQAQPQRQRQLQMKRQQAQRQREQQMKWQQAQRQREQQMKRQQAQRQREQQMMRKRQAEMQQEQNMLKQQRRALNQERARLNAQAKQMQAHERQVQAHERETGYIRNWRDLSPQQQRSAMSIGYTQQTWDSDGGIELMTANGYRWDDDMGWYEIPQQIRNVLCTLGYSESHPEFWDQ